MSDIIFCMSDSALRQLNRGAYSSPFSGVGIEFFPLGTPLDHAGLVLYEAGYLPANDWWNFPNVLSPFWRLYYNARPGHHVIFGDRAVELTPRHVVLIPDGQLFHCRGHQPTPTFWLAFQVARRVRAEQPIPILLPVEPIERALLRDLARRFSERGQPPDRDRIFHGSMALLHVVMSRSEIRWQGKAPPAVVDTVRHIESHYATPLSVPRLARRANLCTEALCRSFKTYQGDTIGQFIIKVRVRESAHLLAHTDATIEEIAERTGFPNRFYLSRVFKRITGESPARFRRRHGQHESAS
jgi:AraC-like DNA-binding protein